MNKLFIYLTTSTKQYKYKVIISSRISTHIGPAQIASLEEIRVQQSDVSQSIQNLNV